MAQQPGAQAPQATDMAQQFAQMMQALAQGQSQLQRAMAEAYTQQTAITRNIATSVEVRDRSELKGIPKPDKFSGHTGTWDSWYFKFKTWIETSHKNAGKCIQLLEEHQDTEINETSLEDDYPEGAELVSAQARQALISLCEGEALEIVKNTSRGQHFGLEALRRLITKYDPQNPQANSALLKKVLHPQQCALDKLRESIEAWENIRRKYEERKKKALDDDIARSCLQQMCPAKLQDHLDLQSSRLTDYAIMKSEILAYLENIESRKEAKTGSAPMDVDALAAAASQMQASLASLAKAKGKGKGGSKGGKGKGKSQDGGKGNDKGKQKGKGSSWSNPSSWNNSWNKNDWYKNDWNKSSWYNQNSKGKGKGGKGKDSKGKGKSKSKKVASVEESETSMAQEHQPEPEYSADIATLFAIEMEKAAPAAISRGAAKAKAETEVKAMPKKPGAGKGRPGIAAAGIAVMNQAIQETMQSNRELYEKKSETIQKAIEEAEAKGKAANDAILEQQAEMKRLKEQYEEKEREAKILLKRPTPRRAASVPAESPRLSADLASGMDPRLAKKKEKSRQRAEQHRVDKAQDRFESWRDYEANYPEELDYYEIARAKGTGRLQAWDDEDDEGKFDEAPQPRGREKAQRHRGYKKPGKAKKPEKPKEKEPKIEDLSTQELAEMKRESQTWTATSHPARSVIDKALTAAGFNPEDYVVMKRVESQGEGATSAPSFAAPVMENINPLDVTEIEGLEEEEEFEGEVEEDENGTEPADEESDGQEEEKEKDTVPWLDHMFQERILSYDEWVAKCTHKNRDGSKNMVCRACNKALRCDNDTGLWNHHMALNCCPPKVLNQWAKEWTIKQKEMGKRIKTAKGQQGSPTSKDAPKHVKDADMDLKPEDVAKHLKMKDPKLETVKKEPPFYMTAHMQQMMEEQEEEDEVGPKTPKQRRIAKTPPPPEKKGKTKEERMAWFKSSTEEHLERFRGPGSKPEESSEAPRQTLRLKSRSRSPGKSRAASAPAASEKGQGKGKQKKVQLTRAVNVATQDAAREAKKGKGKRYPTPSSEPDEGDEDPLALRSLELASMETPMAHQVTLDSGAATSCIPVELATALGYKPIQPEGTCKVYKTASGEVVKDLGKIDAMVTIGIGQNSLNGRCCFRVMAVAKPLLSAGALMSKGWCIQMHGSGGQISRDGTKIPISFSNGVCSVPLAFHPFVRHRNG